MWNQSNVCVHSKRDNIYGFSVSIMFSVETFCFILHSSIFWHFYSGGGRDGGNPDSTWRNWWMLLRKELTCIQFKSYQVNCLIDNQGRHFEGCVRKIQWFDLPRLRSRLTMVLPKQSTSHDETMLRAINWFLLRWQSSNTCVTKTLKRIVRCIWSPTEIVTKLGQMASVLSLIRADI